MSERITDTAIDPLFLDRWSPRAFDGTAISAADLRTIIDAARWAPSAFNYQPWRLLYAVHGDAHWDRFLDLLIPFNRSWAKDAGVLFFILSDTVMTSGSGKESPSHSHSFDAGAAWAQMALQATRLGLHAHGMTGVDFDKARAELGVPDRFRIEAAAVIGRRGDPATLDEGLRAREQPSDRKRSKRSPLPAVSRHEPTFEARFRNWEGDDARKRLDWEKIVDLFLKVHLANRTGAAIDMHLYSAPPVVTIMVLRFEPGYSSKAWYATQPPPSVSILSPYLALEEGGWCAAITASAIFLAVSALGTASPNASLQFCEAVAADAGKEK